MPAQDRKPAPLPPERQLVLFVVGEVLYGLPIERVRGVINAQATIALPHAPAAISGVTDYRGEVVPVIDLRVRFGVVPRQEADALRRVKWILVDVGEGASAQLTAVVVDAVEDVHRTRDALRPAPPLGGGEEDRGIAGVLQRIVGGGGQQRGATGSAMVFVLDVDRLRSLTARLVAPGAEQRAS